MSNSKVSNVWENLKATQRAVYLIGQDVKTLPPKVTEVEPTLGLSKALEECYTFRIQVTDQIYHRIVTKVKKLLQSGGVCVLVRAGDKSALHLHSSYSIDVLLQKLKLSKADVKVEQQAVFLFSITGATAEAEHNIEEALNSNALGGFVTAAAVSGSVLALFATASVARTPDIKRELFTVALIFDRQNCPMSKALPQDQPYKIGVFGRWCCTQPLALIKAALQEKLQDIGLLSVVSNPGGRAVVAAVQGVENAMKARARVVGLVKDLGFRCTSRQNRVLLFETVAPHVVSLQKEVKVGSARGSMAEPPLEALDPLLATAAPTQGLVRTSVLNTLHRLGHAAAIKGCAELVFSLRGVKCTACAGKIQQALQQGPHKPLAAYLNLPRTQLTVRVGDEAVEEAVGQVAKALRGIRVPAELVRVVGDAGEEPDPVTEEECAILRRVTGRALKGREGGEDVSEAPSDDSEPLHSRGAGVTTAALHLTGLSCQACALLLKGTLKTTLRGVSSCAVDFPSRTLYVSYGTDLLSVEDIREKLGSLGHACTLLREGEDLKLKLTDTLWANEASSPPAEDERGQATLQGQALLEELRPEAAPPMPLLDLKHYVSLEETGADAPLGALAGRPAPYTHVSTLPVKLLPEAKSPLRLAVFASLFSRPCTDLAAEEQDDELWSQESRQKGPFDIPGDAFFLLTQCPTQGLKEPLGGSGPTYLRPPPLHFAHLWTFWFDVTVDTKEKHMEDSLRQLGTVGTLQDLWRTWTNLCVSHLRDGCNLRLFRQDIQPTWEHPMNRAGGRWSARSLGKGQRFKLWTEVVLALTGEQLQDNSEHHVCGVCLSSKPGGDRIEVWVDGGHESLDPPPGGFKTTSNTAGDPMDEVLRKMLFPDEDKKYFFYQSHLDYIEQRKTQRGGRRAKARKQNQMDGTFDADSNDEPQRRFFPEFFPATPPGGAAVAAGGWRETGAPAPAYPLPPSRAGYAPDVHAGGVLPGAGPKGYGGKGYGPMYYGGKAGGGGAGGYGGKGLVPYGAPPVYTPYGKGGYGYGKGAYYPPPAPLFVPPAPAPMTPGEADNILAMHSMSGSGLGASDASAWAMDMAAPALAAPEPVEDEEFDPTQGLQVGQLLEELHLEQYVPVMVQKGYADWESMQGLAEPDLVDMGFKPGHRKRLLASLRSGAH